MKKIIFSSIVALLVTAASFAQEYKLAKSTGKIIISTPGVTVEGYDGNEIIFTGREKSGEEDERAKGLRPISASGLQDNTGLGVNVADKGNTVEVTPVGKSSNKLRIKIPKGMSVSYSFSKVMENSTASFKNIEGEIEVSVQYNKVDLENVTGPLTIKAVYGGVDVKFGQNIKGPVSLVSVYGHVDVSMPTATKANLKLNTSWGEILASSEFKIDVEKSGDMVSYSDNHIKGKLNGGGVDMTLTSSYGKVYLRKSN
ncbi:MAG: DUF4097 family beta strand repeat-containing protein [Bacteroidota bacterium]|nr:DUF4097 family beta strand repeat-containing protein [Dolichospermum sp. ST_sed9]